MLNEFTEMPNAHLDKCSLVLMTRTFCIENGKVGRGGGEKKRDTTAVIFQFLAPSCVAKSITVQTECMKLEVMLVF